MLTAPPLSQSEKISRGAKTTAPKREEQRRLMMEQKLRHSVQEKETKAKMQKLFVSYLWAEAL